MQVQFGAKLEIKHPRIWDEAGTQEVFSLDKDPVLKQVLKNTSDQIELTLDANPAVNLGSTDDRRISIANQASIRVKGAEDLSPRPIDVPAFPLTANTYAKMMYQVSRAVFEADENLREEQAATRQEAQDAVASGKKGLAQVAGMEDLKANIKAKVLDRINNPEKYKKYQRADDQDKLGLPNGILMFGAPGVGKTYMADRLAEELGCPKIDLSPSSIADKHIHETVKLIGEKFDEAEKAAQENGMAIVWCDEIDPLLPARLSLKEGADHKKEEIAELLQRMNNCGDKGILFLAASNRPELLDEAATRPGRMDIQLYVPPPDEKARKAALEYQMEGRYQDDKIDYQLLAEKTPGFSQADLRLMVEEAVDRAMAEDAPIGTKHLLSVVEDGLVSASVSPQTEKEYKTIKTRGTTTNQVKPQEKPRLGFTANA